MIRVSFTVFLLAGAACASSGTSSSSESSEPGEATVAVEEGDSSKPSKISPTARQAMRSFRRKVWFLERHLSEWPFGPVKHDKVVRTLNEVITIGQSLEEQEKIAHPVFGERLPYLIREAQMAKGQALADPADYTMARALMGACSECHKDSDCAFDKASCPEGI